MEDNLFLYTTSKMTEEKKAKSKTKRRHYLIFVWIIVVVFLILKSLDSNLKTNEEKIAEYKQELAQIEEAKKDAVPKEFLNALSKAKIYCEMWKSKEWIFEQLTSKAWEWFWEDSANYAIENIDCDYKENALKMWKIYFEEMKMSKNRVKEQLTSKAWEKFTEEEAQFAINNLE